MEKMGTRKLCNSFQKLLDHAQQKMDTVKKIVERKMIEESNGGIKNSSQWNKLFAKCEILSVKFQDFRERINEQFYVVRQNKTKLIACSILCSLLSTGPISSAGAMKGFIENNVKPETDTMVNSLVSYENIIADIATKIAGSETQKKQILDLLSNILLGKHQSLSPAPNMNVNVIHSPLHLQNEALSSEVTEQRRMLTFALLEKTAFSIDQVFKTLVGKFPWGKENDSANIKNLWNNLVQGVNFQSFMFNLSQGVQDHFSLPEDPELAEALQRRFVNAGDVEKLNNQIKNQFICEAKKEARKEAFKKTYKTFNPKIPQEIVDQVISAVDKYANKYGVDPRLIMAIIFTESTGNPKCGTGIARGLMQILATNTRADLWNIDNNILFGVEWFLRKQNLEKQKMENGKRKELIKNDPALSQNKTKLNDLVSIWMSHPAQQNTLKLRALNAYNGNKSGKKKSQYTETVLAKFYIFIKRHEERSYAELIKNNPTSIKFKIPTEKQIDGQLDEIAAAPSHPAGTNNQLHPGAFIPEMGL